MPSDVDEGDEPAVTLERVKPGFDPRIGRNVGPAAKPDKDAVATVIEQGEEDKSPLDEWTEWNSLQVAGNGVVFFRRDQDRAVRPEMLGKESPDGNDS